MIAAICLTFIGFASPVFSKQISLRLRTGSLTIVGKLLSFDGEKYLVETKSLGVVTAKADEFACIKGDCPEASDAGARTSDNEVLRIKTSTTISTRLIPELVRGFAANMGASAKSLDESADNTVFEIRGKDGTSVTTIAVQKGGSETAFSALAAGEADIGIADRPISDEEIGLLTNAGFPQINQPGYEHAVGFDSIVIIISSKNTLDLMSVDNISRIFSGEIRDWSEFKLPSSKINVYATSEQSGAFQTFSSIALKPFRRSLAPSVDTSKSEAELAEAVAQDPAGIGFVSLAELEPARPLVIKDVCGLAHTPSQLRIKSGEFPLARKLHFYTIKPEKKRVKAFLEYSKSPAAFDALRKAGFTNREIVSEPFDHFRDRIFASLSAPTEDFDLDLMRRLMRILGPGKRLSATLRFAGYSTELDSESIGQLPDIVSFLKTRDLTKEKIIVAGYSDSGGPFYYNRDLAMKRAERVRDALINLAPKDDPSFQEIQTESFAELFPAACNDTEAGRLKNRRAEIWLVPVDQSRPVTVSNQP